MLAAGDHPRDHGHAVRDVGVARGAAGGAQHPARGVARARRHALGGGDHRGGALRPLGHHRRHHPRPGPRARRDDGGDDAHRQPARDRGVAVRAGLHDGRRDRQRVLRGRGRHAPLGAGLRRVPALRGDGGGERGRAAPHLAGGPRLGRREQGPVNRPHASRRAVQQPDGRADDRRRRRGAAAAGLHPGQPGGQGRRQPLARLLHPDARPRRRDRRRRGARDRRHAASSWAWRA